VRPRRKWKGSSTQSFSTLGSTTPGSYTSAASLPPQERTKGGDTTLTVPADGAITTKITRAVAAQTATTTIWYTLHPKDASRPWVVGRTTRGHHPVHDGQTSENPYNRRRKKGVAGGGASDKGHDRSLDHRPTDNTISQSRSTLAKSEK
jgi:hypothetical protein